MIMIVGGRGSGRTTEMIRYSSESNVPLAVGSEHERRRIVHQAYAMGVDIPTPVVIGQLPRAMMGSRKREVAIDNVEAILREVTGCTPTIVTCDMKNFATEDLALLDCLALWRRSRRLYKKGDVK